MLLKKQTVWLLTMLSLVVVLSVYYITAPEQENVAFEEMKQESENQETTGSAEGVKQMEDKTEVSVEEMGDGTVISSISSDELFAQLRMDIEDQRNQLREQLSAIVASSEVSAEDKSEALDKMEKLSTMAQKEAVLETLIKSKGYDDALVRADGDQVRITVKAGDHSATEADEIIQLVSSEISGLKDIAVAFQPTK